MIRQTGIGRVEERRVLAPPGVCVIQASLYNFDIEGDTPKPEHEQWLRDHVVPLLPNRSVKVRLRGEASRSGSDSFNLCLSQRRVDKVLAFLKRNGLVLAQFERQAVGEDDARRAGEANGTEDEKFRAVVITVESPHQRLIPVRFDRPFHLGINDGFDDTTSPPWVMVTAEDPSRLMQVENAEGLFLVSTNPGVAVPQPALFPQSGPVHITRSPQIFRIVAGVPGDAEIQAVDPQGCIQGRLQVSALTQLTVKCAFHYIKNAKYGTRKRKRGDEAKFMRVLNSIWPAQANINFAQLANNTQPTIDMTDNLGNEINTIGNTLTGDWFPIVNNRDSKAQFNVFFVREVETDAEGTRNKRGAITDTADALTQIGGNGDCIFEDNISGRRLETEEVALAHEAGHCLTLDHDSPVATTIDMLMWAFTNGGRFLARAHVLQARRNVRKL